MIRILFIGLCCWILPANAQKVIDITYDKDSLHDEYTIHALRFYISDLKFHIAEGAWQSEENSFHLIDIEDSDSWKIPLSKELAKSPIDSISFLIGIDSLTNVSGVLDGDLDPIKGMYWAWNSGYINFKVEGQVRATQTKFEYHLGGYLPPFPTARQVIFSRDPKDKKLIIHLSLMEFLNQIDMAKFNEVIIPGAQAAALSNKLSHCFSLE